MSAHSPEIRGVGPLADVQTGLLVEAVSRQGRRVTLTLDCGRYEGAKPFFAVVYLHRDARRPQVVRYTSSGERATMLFELFVADVIEPAALVLGDRS
jgi:hypothetical protein